MRDRYDDRGQAAIVLVIVVLALAACVVTALAQLGGSTRDRVRAQSAADAAALASLDGGRDEADRVASANDSVVVSWSRGPGEYEVTVTVRVGDEIARATATNEP